MKMRFYPTLGCMLIMLCVFFGGCLDDDKEQENLGLDQKINLAEGSDLDIYGVVVNTGTSEQPDYNLTLIIKNNGISKVTYDALISSFCDVNFGQPGTNIHNSTLIDRNDFNSVTLSPGEATLYTFSSGPNTSKVAETSGGAMLYRVVLFKDVDGGIEMIFFARANLPKVLGNETSPVELNPGEAQEIKFERPDY